MERALRGPPFVTAPRLSRQCFRICPETHMKHQQENASNLVREERDADFAWSAVAVGDALNYAFKLRAEEGRTYTPRQSTFCRRVRCP